MSRGWRRDVRGCDDEVGIGSLMWQPSVKCNHSGLFPLASDCCRQGIGYNSDQWDERESAGVLLGKVEHIDKMRRNSFQSMSGHCDKNIAPRNWFPFACGWSDSAEDSWTKKGKEPESLWCQWAAKSISPGTVLYFDFLLCEIINSLLIKSTEPKFLVNLKAYWMIQKAYWKPYPAFFLLPPILRPSYWNK